MSPLGWLLVGLVRAYQLFLRPVLGANCRFEPHCSAYAIEAIRRHGALRGAVLAAWRVLRCNPWSAGGYDPVPADFCRCGTWPPHGKTEH
jgi:putative membrane protein insertion efficiency factor